MNNAPVIKIGNKQLTICLLLVAHCFILFSSLVDGNHYVVTA
jgi:hypothetical protein